MSAPAPQAPTLADEIKSSEKLYVDAAMATIRKNLSAEYCRLRGYAVEAQRDAISLQMTVTFGFDPANRFVLVESTPNFAPRPASTMLSLSPKI